MAYTLHSLLSWSSTPSQEIRVAARHLDFGFTTKIFHPSEIQIKKEGIVKVATVTENTAEKEKLDRKAIVKTSLKMRKGASNKLCR